MLAVESGLFVDSKMSGENGQKHESRRYDNGNPNNSSRASRYENLLPRFNPPQDNPYSALIPPPPQVALPRTFHPQRQYHSFGPPIHSGPQIRDPGPPIQTSPLQPPQNSHGPPINQPTLEIDPNSTNFLQCASSPDKSSTYLPQFQAYIPDCSKPVEYIPTAFAKKESPRLAERKFGDVNFGFKSHDSVRHNHEYRNEANVAIRHNSSLSPEGKKRLDKGQLDREIEEKKRLDKERLDREIEEKKRLDKELLDREIEEKKRLDKEQLDREIEEKKRLDKEQLDREIEDKFSQISSGSPNKHAEEDDELKKVLELSLQDTQYLPVAAAASVTISPEEARDFHRELRRNLVKCSYSSAEIKSLLEVCKRKQAQLQRSINGMLNEDGIDSDFLDKLLHLNFDFNDAIQEAECLPGAPAEVYDLASLNTALETSVPSLPSNVIQQEVMSIKKMVENNDVFNLICMLLSESKLEATEALLK